LLYQSFLIQLIICQLIKATSAPTTHYQPMPVSGTIDQAVHRTVELKDVKGCLFYKKTPSD